METAPSNAWAWGPPCVALLLAAAIVATGSDHWLFLVLNREGRVLGEHVWTNLTLLGDGAVALALVVPCIRCSPRCFWAALIAAVVAGVGVQLLKHAVNVPRPLVVFGAGHFAQFGPPYRGVSFPSGHAAAIFAIAGIWVMGMCKRPLVRVLLLALASLVGLSRVMIGVHWPLDVVSGMLVGWAAAWIGLAVYPRLGWKTAGVGGLAAGTVLLALAAALLFSRHIGIPAVLPLQRALGAICLVWGAAEMLQMASPMCRQRLRSQKGK